jgi:ceramide glucosyltransferase
MKAALALVPVAISIALYVTSLVGLAKGLRRRTLGEPRLARYPRVSILKPLAGVDDELAQNLASFARIDYPAFELLLGVASESDPALGAARAFLRDYPWIEGRVVITDPASAHNPKVAQLVGLETDASGEVLVISDSNVRVEPRYLARLVAALEAPGVGLVSSLVVGTGERSLGAALENLNLGATFAPFVASASVFADRALCIGKSMAMRRGVLARLGGFRRVGDVLGEDHVLGRVFEQAGWRVVTSMDPVENRNVDCTVRRTFERHARWAKMRRAVAPAAFAIEPIASPALVSALAAALCPSPIAFAALGVATALQIAGAAWALRTLRGRSPAARLAVLEIPRTLVLFACWISAWGSRRISWRGHPYRLHRGSVITPVPAAR